MFVPPIFPCFLSFSKIQRVAELTLIDLRKVRARVVPFPVRRPHRGRTAWSDGEMVLSRLSEETWDWGEGEGCWWGEGQGPEVS